MIKTKLRNFIETVYTKAALASSRRLVKFHRAASIIAHNVVTACGKDPAVTTASEMDEQDFRVECRRCSKGVSSRLAMTWTMAVCVNYSG